MLELLTEQPPDKILMLSQMYREDPRDDKIDLGVGVYRDASGNTPVMRAVKEAERRILEGQGTKAYTSLAGDPAFADAMIDLVLGGAVPRDGVAAVATPGGTGAVRQGLELVRMANPGAAVWLPLPTWPNHPTIVKHLGMPSKTYRYFDDATRALDWDGLAADLDGVPAGDVVVLHGCCHNPTGANPTLDQWRGIVDILKRRGVVPFIDIAYQGFGDGLDEDAGPTRMIASEMPEAIIAASCSKNFGIYRERTGLLIAVAHDSGITKTAQGNLAYLNRQNYSFPPDHGARVVTTILTDPELRGDWRSELEQTRVSMLDLRGRLADELRRFTNSDRFDFIAEHRGMFSRIGATAEKVAELREKHRIYMVGDSRMNIAGLNADTVPILARAIVDVGI